MSKPPIGLVSVAWMLVLLGSLSMADLVSAVLLRRDPSVDLGVFLLPLGIGLLRRSSLARRLAEALTASLGIVGLFGLVAAVLLSFQAKFSWSSIITILSVVATLAAVALVHKVLIAERTFQWIDSKSEHGPGRRFQFGLSTLMLVMLVVAVLAARFPKEESGFGPRRIITTISPNGPNGPIHQVTYGVREHRKDEDRNQVDFVIIETSATSTLKSMVSQTWSFEGTTCTNHEAVIVLPDGRMIRLPEEEQFCEIKDGVFRAASGDVTWRQLQAFLDKFPADPAIDTLLRTP